MLVMLIIFLVTIPIILKVAPVELPTATNQALKTKPENIVISVDKDGNLYWNATRLADIDVLRQGLEDRAQLKPQPEVEIRGDKDARYEFIGRVIVTCQKAGILKVGFITNPDLPKTE
jgi:biopolymer transport protein ExbD